MSGAEHPSFRAEPAELGISLRSIQKGFFTWLRITPHVRAVEIVGGSAKIGSVAQASGPGDYRNRTIIVSDGKDLTFEDLSCRVAA